MNLEQGPYRTSAQPKKTFVFPWDIVKNVSICCCIVLCIGYTANWIYEVQHADTLACRSFCENHMVNQHSLEYYDSSYANSICWCVEIIGDDQYSVHSWHSNIIDGQYRFSPR